MLPNSAALSWQQEHSEAAGANSIHFVSVIFCFCFCFNFCCFDLQVDEHVEMGCY